jgi:hypothetical protein
MDLFCTYFNEEILPKVGVYEHFRYSPYVEFLYDWWYTLLCGNVNVGYILGGTGGAGYL